MCYRRGIVVVDVPGGSRHAQVSSLSCEHGNGCVCNGVVVVMVTKIGGWRRSCDRGRGVIAIIGGGGG